MNTAKVLEFPYGRIRQEPEAHTAKILHMPDRSVDLFMLPMAFMAAWLSAFRV
jgi:hypothetical protein